MKTCKRILIFLALNVRLFAQTLPDISIDKAPWKLDPGVVREHGEFFFQGKEDQYQKATLVVGAESLKGKAFYLTGEVFLSNVVPGKVGYRAPKFKVYVQENERLYLADNIPISGNSPGWVSHSLKWTSKSKGDPKEFRLEVAMQECTGIFRVRNLALSFEPPVSSKGFVYPWKIPDSTAVARLELSGTPKPVSERLFGLNSQFVGEKDSSWNYGRFEIRDLIKRVGATVLRFPGGTVANWYDFETDAFAIPTDRQRGPKENLLSSMENRIGLKFGYPGYLTLVKNENLGCIQTFNILQDSPEKSVRRLQKLYADGLQPIWIELGNENDDRSQQSDLIADARSYLEKCKLIAKALKAFDPKVRLAVNTPLLDGEWAEVLAKENFYDGVVTHPYLNLNAKSGELDWAKSKALLTADQAVRNLLGKNQNVFGRRPLVLSEWGVIAPAEINGSPLTAFATALAFLSVLEAWEGGSVDLACLHIAYGNFMGLAYAKGPSSEDLRLRPYEAIFTLITRAFRDSSLYESKSVSPELAPGVESVLARATRSPGGSVHLYAVNRANIPQMLEVSLEGKRLNGKYETSVFEMGGEPGKKAELSATESFIQKTSVRESAGKTVVALPPLSVSVIEWPQP